MYVCIICCVREGGGGSCLCYWVGFLSSFFSLFLYAVQLTRGGGGGRMAHTRNLGGGGGQHEKHI